MTEHEQHAARLEREADDMQRRSEQLGEDISAAREDWERKRGEESVPGAAPGPGAPQEGAEDPREPWPDE